MLTCSVSTSNPRPNGKLDSRGILSLSQKVLATTQWPDQWSLTEIVQATRGSNTLHHLYNLKKKRRHNIKLIISLPFNNGRGCRSASLPEWYLDEPCDFLGFFLGDLLNGSILSTSGPADILSYLSGSLQALCKGEELRGLVLARMCVHQDISLVCHLIITSFPFVVQELYRMWIEPTNKWNQ